MLKPGYNNYGQEKVHGQISSLQGTFERLVMKWIMVRTAVKTFGGSQPRIKEGALHHAWRGKNAEAFLISVLLKKCT